uniref:Uncharacterized protein n=1 Tax=Rhizophora mucronata TaxID=61149 RepID=A0A2P2PLW3_RHIMU
MLTMEVRVHTKDKWVNIIEDVNSLQVPLLYSNH